MDRYVTCTISTRLGLHVGIDSGSLPLTPKLNPAGCLHNQTTTIYDKSSAKGHRIEILEYFLFIFVLLNPFNQCQHKMENGSILITYCNSYKYRIFRGRIMYSKYFKMGNNTRALTILL